MTELRALLGCWLASRAQHSTDGAALLLSPVYKDPWVAQHVALTYANEQLTDGLGAQATRVLGLQAIACSLGLQWVAVPLLKVAHTNHLLARWNKMLQLPSSASLEDLGSYRVVNTSGLSAKSLASLVSAAAQAKQPTLIRACFVHGLVNHHPEVFHCLPRCKPKPWECAETAMRSVRLALHIRRGDITKKEDSMRRRGLPPSYFISVAKNITNGLQALGRDVLVEVFTESQVFFPPGSPDDEHHMPTAQLYKLLRDSLPNVVLFPDADEMWTLQQMATADVLVQSISSFSTLAGLLNQRGVVVAPPVKHVLHMPHWLAAAGVGGAFDADGYGLLQAALRTRYDGLGCHSSSSSGGCHSSESSTGGGQRPGEPGNEAG